MNNTDATAADNLFYIADNQYMCVYESQYSVSRILTGVSWQAELADIVHGGTVVRVEGEADQREDQGLHKTTPEMQIVKHDVGCV